MVTIANTKENNAKVAARINGLIGIYMVNQDGSIFCEARVIKEDEKKFKIEYLTNEGWNEFEKLYSQFIHPQQTHT